MTQAPGLCANARISVGNLFRINEDKVHVSETVEDVFKEGRILVFGGPAPFSRLDTTQAIEYQSLSEELLNTGLDEIIGLYCQDAFVMKEFRSKVVAETGKDNITFWGDGDGSFATGHGMSHNFTSQGLSVRTLRWAAVVQNGVIEYIEIDDFSEIEKTKAISLLRYLKNET
jgi:peroxiredoxin